MANTLRTHYYENLLEILSTSQEEKLLNDYLSQFNPINKNEQYLQTLKKYSENLVKSESKIKCIF